MRVLALYFPKLAMALSTAAVPPEPRGNPSQRRRMGLPPRRECPVALMQGYGDDAIVSAVSNEAALRGVLVGMTAGAARARCREAQFRPDNAGAGLDALERVAAILAARVTPFVEIGGRDVLFLGIEIAGAQEPRLAAQVARLARQWCATEVRAGIADDRQGAMEAARAARRHPLVCPPNESTQAIGPLDLAATIAVTAAVPVSGDTSAMTSLALRLSRKLDLLLDARGASFRELRLTVSDPGRGAKEWRQTLRAPQHETRSLLPDLVAAAGGQTGSRHATLRIELRHLGPDVRVQPLLPARAAPHSAVA